MSKRFDLDVGKRRLRKRWREFVKKRSFDRKQQRILCFPGEYGFEIEQVYRPLGFKDENIFGVERDPDAAKAIRSRYPKINLFEGEMVDFVNQYEGPPFGVVSLDYCGHFSDDKMKPLMLLTAGGRLGDRCCVCLNLLAGREQTEDKETLRSLYARFLQDQSLARGESPLPPTWYNPSDPSARDHVDVRQKEGRMRLRDAERRARRFVAEHYGAYAHWYFDICLEHDGERGKSWSFGLQPDDDETELSAEEIELRRLRSSPLVGYVHADGTIEGMY